MEVSSLSNSVNKFSQITPLWRSSTSLAPRVTVPLAMCLLNRRITEDFQDYLLSWCIAVVGSFNMKHQLRMKYQKVFWIFFLNFAVLRNSLILLFWQIFGAYATHPFRFSDHYYGTGETFLYTFSPTFKVSGVQFLKLFCWILHLKHLWENFMKTAYLSLEDVPAVDECS